MGRVSRAGWRRVGVAWLFLGGIGLLLPGLGHAAGKRTAVERATASAGVKSPSAAKRAASVRATKAPRARAPAASKAGVAKRQPKATVARVQADVRAQKGPVARVVASRSVEPSRPSIGHAFGLHDVTDPLSLESAVALVLDQQSGQVLFEKNSRAVLPIASISKLMTAVVVLDAKLAMTEMLEISEADVDTERNTRSRLHTGTRLTRDELLHLALMSSENRAAHALGRNYPGGLAAFVAQMNRKAIELGMTSSSFVEPTGLSSSNVSSARDLALLVQAAFHYPLIREYSTASALSVDTGFRTVNFRNTNRLIDRDDWQIGLQKTGFISEAGNCLVMQTRIDERPLVFVLLDAQGRRARIGDAHRIRSWLERDARSGMQRDVQRTLHPPKIDPIPGTDAERAQTSV